MRIERPDKWQWRLTGALVLAALCGTAAGAEEYRYTVIMSGHVAGEHVSRIDASGRIKTAFSYRENGRGPDLFEDIALARDGSVASFAIRGTSTFGAKADEKFTRRGNRVEWSGVVDRGRLTVDSPAVYMPLTSTIEMDGLILREILRAPNAQIATLPGGQVRAQKLLDTVAKRDGATQAISLYSVTGVSLTPWLVWTAADGSRIFADISPGWSRVIAKGWEANGDELERLQVEADAKRQRDIAQRLRHALPQPILIRNARVFDAEHARLGAPQDIYINDGRIAALYPANSAPRTSGTEFDAAGRTLLPGLFDMHAHVSTFDYLLNLAAGVTTVRDMGNDNAVLADAMAKLARYEAIGPHVVPAGFIEGRSPHNASGGIVVESLDEAKRAVDFYAQHGYPQIKIYNSFKPEWVADTAAYAHALGLRVSGHVPAFMRAEEAVRNGYDEIQHINQVLLNFFVKPDTDTRTLLRFTLVANEARNLDLDGERFTNFVKLLVERKTVLDPTLATFEDQFTQRSGELSASYGMLQEHLPSRLRRQLRQSTSEITAEMAPRWRASFQQMLAATARFHRAGIPLVAGTDGFAGFTLQRELELYVQAGIPANEVLKIATWNGATYARVLGDRGSIERGKRADLILVDGDPTQNIADLRKLSLVLQDGAAYYPAELYEEIGVKPFVSALKPAAAK